MDIKGWKDYFVVVAFSLVVAGAVVWLARLNVPRPGARDAVAAWPETSRLTAEAMIERYGAPDVQNEERLSWYARPPWKRVIVHRFPSESPLEQTVGYRMPRAMGEPLRRFGHGVSVNEALDEISARGDREGLNILALNMAHQIATGRMTGRQAEKAFVETADRAASGKSSRLMRHLLFEPFAPPPPPLDRGLVY